MSAEGTPRSLSHNRQNKYCVSPEPAIYRIYLTLIRFWDSMGSAQAKENAAPQKDFSTGWQMHCWFMPSRRSSGWHKWSLILVWSLFPEVICYVKNRWQTSVQHLENVKALGSLSMQWGEVTSCLPNIFSFSKWGAQTLNYLVEILSHWVTVVFYSRRGERENF